MDYITGAWNDLGQWLASLTGMQIVVLVILILLFTTRRPRIVIRWGTGGKNLMPDQREDWAQRYAADLITDVLEEAVADDKLTRKEVNKIYRGMGKACNIPDLLAPDLRALKKQIKGRLRTGFYRKPIPVPGTPLTVKSRVKSMSLTSK